MLDLDLAARIVDAAPLRDRRRQRRRGQALLGENADQGVDHRLGHGEARQLCVDADAGCVTFGDHLAVAHHHDRPGAPKRRRCRLFEGMIQCGLKRGIGRLDHCRAGDLEQ